jgi:hypothetical protein
VSVRWVLALAWLVGACAPPPHVDLPPLPTPELEPPSPGKPETPDAIAQMLARVSMARGLAAKQPVQVRHVSRAEAIAHIIAKTEREMPRAALEGQGELLRAMGLVPPEYDFVGGIFTLLRNNIAGFYDQHEKSMFLLDDLSKTGDEETLAHELAHALQDQHYDLVGMLRYQQGAADSIGAIHSLCEGDATAATVATLYGDGVQIDADQLRMAMVAGVALAEGKSTPRVLQLALVSPYVDGFRFVAALRARGGWPAVDAAFARLPTSTEQLLHLEKYDTAEPPLAVAPPPLPEGEGWNVLTADVLGEQGLRLVLEAWTTRARATAGAAGWGGDHFTVGRRIVGDATEHAAAWSLVFDDEHEAAEAASLFTAELGTKCRERGDLGPLAFRRRGAMIVLVAGPYTEQGDKFVSAGSCQGALRWVDTIFASR